MIDSDLILGIATTPVSADSPAGESLRYDEAVTNLEQEVAKLDNVAGGEIDWRRVEQESAAILARRSKDVLIAAWLVRALWQRDGMAGLALGLETLRDLLANFWEPLHPQRVRPRRAALEWLSEKLGACLEQEPPAKDPAAVARALAAIEQIIAWSAGRFEESDAGLSTLHRQLRAAQEKSPVVVSTPASEEGSTAMPASPETDAAAPTPARSSVEGPIRNRDQANARLKELADWFATHEPLSPVVLLLRRAESWNHKDFREVYAELLRNRQEAKGQLWDALGIEDPPT